MSSTHCHCLSVKQSLRLLVTGIVLVNHTLTVTVSPWDSQCQSHTHLDSPCHNVNHTLTVSVTQSLGQSVPVKHCHWDCPCRSHTVSVTQSLGQSVPVKHCHWDRPCQSHTVTGTNTVTVTVLVTYCIVAGTLHV